MIRLTDKALVDEVVSISVVGWRLSKLLRSVHDDYNHGTVWQSSANSSQIRKAPWN